VRNPLRHTDHMYLARSVFGQWYPGEPAAAVAGLSAGAITTFLLYRFVRRVPWPRPFRLRFVVLHLVAAPVFGVSWILLTIAIESLFTGSLLDTRTGRRLVELPSELPMTAVLLYVVVIGIAYSMERRERTANSSPSRSCRRSSRVLPSWWCRRRATASRGSTSRGRRHCCGCSIDRVDAQPRGLGVPAARRPAQRLRRAGGAGESEATHEPDLGRLLPLFVPRVRD